MRTSRKLAIYCCSVHETAELGRSCEIRIRRKDVSVWDVELQMWRLPQGAVVFHVGSSSRKLPLVSKARARSRLSRQA
jgi:hypothetical protein